MPPGRVPASAAGVSRTSAGELSGLDAGRAHMQPLGRPVDGGPDDLDVGVPAARGAAMRVGDPVAEARPLAADVADSSHGIAPLVWLGGWMPPGRTPGASRRRIADSLPSARTGARRERGGRPAAVVLAAR